MTQSSVRRFHVIGFHTEGGRTVTPMSVGAPSNGFVAEDNITFYVAEDGLTFYIQES